MIVVPDRGFELRRNAIAHIDTVSIQGPTVIDTVESVFGVINGNQRIDIDIPCIRDRFYAEGHLLQPGIRAFQWTDGCFVAKPSTSDSGGDLPDSKLLRREVYIKEAKGKTAVRKLLVWKTNKEKVSEDHPGFVVHWTDYSPDRKDPIKRTVRLASSKKNATSIADKLIEDNVKKGWELAEPT